MIKEFVDVLVNLGEKETAINLLKTLGKHSKTLEQNDLIAQTFFNLKCYKESLFFSEQCLKLCVSKEQEYNCKLNHCNVLLHAYEPEKALEGLNFLEKINPNDSDIQLKKAYGLFLVGKRDEAESILKYQLKNPKNTLKIKNEIEFNLGTYELYRDNLQEGLKKFLIGGRKINLWKKPQLPFKYWNGEEIANKTLVVRAEAGIGDEIINVRFMRHLEEKNINPIWYTDNEEMCKIFNRNGYKSINSIKNLIHNNIYWCHSMDLPILLNLKQEDLWKGPYLKCDNNLKSSIRKTDKLKIGLRWQGNPEYANDLHRSIPLKQIMSSLQNLDADFYSLQRDTGLEELEDFTEIVPLHKNSLKTFEQTMREIDDLDIVISSCTSIVHAAASMGKKVFVLTPMSSYYLWCHSTKQSPWYGDNVTVLRQTKPRYWDEPLKELEKHMNENHECHYS